MIIALISTNVGVIYVCLIVYTSVLKSAMLTMTCFVLGADIKPLSIETYQPPNLTPILVKKWKLLWSQLNGI